MSVKTEINRLGKDTMVYGIGSALKQFIVYLLFPIYTRVLSVADVGLQDIVLASVSIITSLAFLGLDSSVASYYYEKEETNKKIIFSTWLWFELILTLFIVLIVFSFPKRISSMFFGTTEYSNLLKIAIFIVPTAVLSKISTFALRLNFKPVAFSMVAIAGALGQAIIAIIFLVSMKLGLLGLILAIIISNTINLLIGFVLTHREFEWKIDLAILKKLLAFGVPLVPTSISTWLLNNSNKYFLLNQTSLEEIGTYGIASRFSHLIAFFCAAFLTAWPVFAFSLKKDEDIAKATYKKVLTYFLIVTISASTFVSLFGKEMILFITTKDYLLAYKIIPYLSFGIIAGTATDIVSIGFALKKKNIQYLYSVGLGALFTIGMNYLLIPIYGILGAAIAVLSGNIARFFYGLFVGMHYFPVKYEYKKILIVLTVATSCIIFGLLIDSYSLEWDVWQTMIKLLISFTFVGCLFIFRILSIKEIKSFIEILKGWATRQYKLNFGRKNNKSYP